MANQSAHSTCYSYSSLAPSLGWSGQTWSVYVLSPWCDWQHCPQALQSQLCLVISIQNTAGPWEEEKKEGKNWELFWREVEKTKYQTENWMSLFVGKSPRRTRVSEDWSQSLSSPLSTVSQWRRDLADSPSPLTPSQIEKCVGAQQSIRYAVKGNLIIITELHSQSLIFNKIQFQKYLI